MFLVAAFLAQLIQGDKEVNRRIKSICHEALGNLSTNSDKAQDEREALATAVESFRELSEWSKNQPQRKGDPRGCGKELLQYCRKTELLAGTEICPVESLESIPTDEPEGPVKIYCDGVFDLVHAGHFNAIRQAAQLGDELYVGVCSDEEALRAKGVYPLYTVEERMEIVSACKWVKGVFADAPYDVNLDFFKSTGCNFVAHGDDMALNENGIDCYEEIRRAGLLKVFKRTEGVSTTTLVSRLLGVVDSVPATPGFFPPNTSAHKYVESMAHQLPRFSIDADPSPSELSDASPNVCAAESAMKQSLMSSRRLAQFMGAPKTAPPGARIIYTDGSFDIFHNGHVRLLEKAKSMGDFLIVGIYDDPTVRSMKGPGYPIQGMLDRMLSVTAMRAVDEVLMGVPADPTEYLIKTFKISAVVRGEQVDVENGHVPTLDNLKGFCEVFIVDSGSDFTTETVVQRIKDSRDRIRESIAKRKAKELNFYAQEQNDRPSES